MNHLECQVTSCAHYCSNCCCLPKIEVDGPAARESSQTCCMSFQEKQGSMENATACGKTPSVETGIHCEADHCAHNENCKCTASAVCVGCGCENVSAKSGTECCTFRSR